MKNTNRRPAKYPCLFFLWVVISKNVLFSLLRLNFKFCYNVYNCCGVTLVSASHCFLKDSDTGQFIQKTSGVCLLCNYRTHTTPICFHLEQLQIWKILINTNFTLKVRLKLSAYKTVT